MTASFESKDFMEHERVSLTAFASDLRLPPGRWPRTIVVKFPGGNEIKYQLVKLDENQAIYFNTEVTEFGKLTIFND